MYYHCLRAIDRAAAARSPQGLLYTGNGDWNDGLSEIGGESVWLTQFFAVVLKNFLPFARDDERPRLQALLDETVTALDGCFENGYFLRAICPDGEALGRTGGGWCEIDLLPQAFSALVEGGNAEVGRSRSAMENAWKMLWKKDAGLFLLFDPPYRSTGRFPGYLGGYCPGFRENGGQYTHAALWGAVALFSVGMPEKGLEVMRAVNPLTRENGRYKIEPYVLAGDVYSAFGYVGRGGWSHYTGSAGWYLYALLHALVGLRFFPGGFRVEPKLTNALSSFCFEMTKNDTFYRIEASLGEQNALLLDGNKAKNQFFFDKGAHIVKIILQKTKE